MTDTIKQVRKYCNSQLTISGILLTRHNPRTVLGRDLQAVLEREAAALNTRVFTAAIRDSVIIKQAQVLQQGLFTLQGGAIDDYREFIKEFETL